MSGNRFLTSEDEKIVVCAIEEAEKNTSGEIRVHIERECVDGDAYARAVQVFDQIGMSATLLRNGVMIYLATESHCFAIIGDKGIYDKVPTDFWHEEKEILAKYLAAGKAAEGLSLAIKAIGVHLRQYFPYQDDDVNELSNDISYGE